MISFIDDHRGPHGIEPICEVLPRGMTSLRQYLPHGGSPSIVLHLNVLVQYCTFNEIAERIGS
jgi:hypothetical protein